MKRLMKRLEEAERRANAIDQAWENDYENEELEKEFMKAYEEEHKAFNELAEAIVRFTAGQIEKKTAATMIRAQRNELKAIISKIA